MAKLKKCTEKDITFLLETSTEEHDGSSQSDPDKSYNPKKNSDTSTDVSETDEIFENNKRFLLQNNASKKEQVSLRLRLRRSTEQSMYKIDTESEDEKPRRLTRSTKVRLKSLQDENQSPRKGTRIIKLPKRHFDYNSFYSKSEESVLERDQINYNEKKLLLNSLNVCTESPKAIDCKVINNSSDSDCVCINVIPKTPSSRTRSRTKLNKQNCVTEDDSDNATPKIRTRSKYKSFSAKKELKKDNIDEPLSDEENFEADAKENVSFSNTPKRSRIQKSDERTNSTVSSKRQLMYKDKNKSKTDQVEVIHKAGKILSKNISEENDDAIKSTMVLNGLSTPKSRKVSLKQSALTPSMKMRTDMLPKPATPLQEIRTRLHVSVVPKSLPCREQEFNNIYTFLESKLMDNSGGSIYINGVPGTGKTATVNEIVKCLKRSVEKGKLKYFDFIEINGMKLSEPRQAYVQILKQLTKKVLTWEQAYNELEKIFNSNIKRPMTLLLVDEVY
ncbi:hypothetical protein PUN28_007563 [Cardiocondyla obscurior]|uniref:Origin recognition complex subunit 1 n=1 Tax=Cardiocondyla obscurior TaxID=286306 RepID=A0AAW2G701_9HYME